MFGGLKQMLGRLNHQRIQERAEKGWQRLGPILDECQDEGNLVEWFSWMEAEEEFQTLVEAVVSRRKRHFRAPTVETVASILETAPGPVHVVDLALALKVRGVLAPPNILARILEEHSATRGPFKKLRNHGYKVITGGLDAAPRTAKPR